MAYEIKDYLKAINNESKEDLMKSDTDQVLNLNSYEKKYGIYN